MNAAELRDACDLAESLCVDAAEISASLLGKISIERKADDSPVTEADLRIQEHIVSTLLKEYPSHAIIGEESVVQQAPSLSEKTPVAASGEYTWVIDPLDGTRNFTHQFPIFATSIALLHHVDPHGRAVPVAGVVREHLSGWTCSAVVGQGTYCNRRRITLANSSASGDAASEDASKEEIVSGLDTLIAIPSGRGKPILPVIKTFFDKYVLRNVGSTALHLAYTAAGAVDAVFCHECKIWDVAAGALLVSEAGGRCTDLSREPLTPFDLTRNHNADIPFFAASPDAFDTLFDELNLPGG